MSEQAPKYETKKATEYRVNWHDGEIATHSCVLADDVLVTPDSNVLYLYLENELVFCSQTWTSVIASNKLPQE